MSVRRIINSINYRVVGPLTGRDARNWADKTDSRKTHRRQFEILRGSRPVKFEDERVWNELAPFGQSLCVLRK